MQNRLADGASRRGFVTTMVGLAGGGIASLVVAQITSAKPADAGTLKIAVIDSQGAIAGTAEGKATYAQVQSQFASRQSDLNTISKQISDDQAKLNAGQSTLSEEEKDRLQNRITELQQSGARKMQDLQEDQQAAGQDMMSDISAKMAPIVNKYASDNGFTLVLDSGGQTSGVVYWNPAIEITQAIISLYDAANPPKQSSGAAPPSSTPRGTPSTARPNGGTTSSPKTQ